MNRPECSGAMQPVQHAGVKALSTLSVLLLCTGCGSEKRCTFELLTPRAYLWVRESPSVIRASLQNEGLSIREEGDEGGYFLVEGVGMLKWSGVNVIIEPKQVTVNGTTLESRPEAYRNFVIDRNGRVKPNAFLWRE